MIVSDHVIVQDLSAIVIALNEDAIFQVSSDADVLLDYGFADEFFVGATYDAIELAFLNLVEGDDGKGAVDFNAVVVLEDEIAADVGFTCETHLHTGFVLFYTVVDYLQFELFTDQMDAN